ncbi:MAG: pilus assembly protein PilM [Spirochaetia bacterium]|nr:pilus assembly protein PilM [Spirochaetia bacterium]
MFENIAAIDIGTSGVRMIKAKSTLNNFHIRSLSYESIDMRLPDKKEAAILALRKMLADDPVDGYRIISNLPMETAIIRSITFPFNEPGKIAEALPFEAAENVPFAVSELAMDFRPLWGGNSERGCVLLAAAKKDAVNSFIEIFQESGVTPSALGLEADALFSCYSRLGAIQDETAIQLHIGNSKSIINIIKEKSLCYTRASSVSLADIHKGIAAYLGISEAEAVNFLIKLKPDIVSASGFADNTGLKLSKQQMKKIFALIAETFNNLIEQMQLTIRAYRAEGHDDDFGRILTSGGGANITGVSAFLSRGMEIPASALPFVPEYRDPATNSLFHIPLGMIISYSDKKNGAVNFLKGEFIPGINAKTRKLYSLAAFFLALSAAALLINFIIILIAGSSSSSKYEKTLGENYMKYFGEKTAPPDPVAAAKEKLKKEKKEFDSLAAVIGESTPSLELMNDILSKFEQDPSFELKNFVINENTIRIDGSTASAQGIENFRRKIQQSGGIDSASINITSARNGNSSFTLTIKRKKETK